MENFKNLKNKQKEMLKNYKKEQSDILQQLTLQPTNNNYIFREIELEISIEILEDMIRDDYKAYLEKRDSYEEKYNRKIGAIRKVKETFLLEDKIEDEEILKMIKDQQNKILAIYKKEQLNIEEQLKLKPDNFNYIFREIELKINVVTLESIIKDDCKVYLEKKDIIEYDRKMDALKKVTECFKFKDRKIQYDEYILEVLSLIKAFITKIKYLKRTNELIISF